MAEFVGSIYATYELRTEGFERSINKTADNLRKLRKQVDKTSNDGSRSMDKFRRSVNDAAQASRNFTAAFQGFQQTSMIAIVLAAGAALIQFGGALITASGALLTLPAAGLIAAGAMGTFKIGLLGVEDALKAVASGDIDKLNEAMKNLSPNAQAFVRSAAGFREAFKPIQLAVQDALFTNLGNQMNAIAANVLPGLQGGFVNVANALNGLIQRGLEVAQTPLFKGLVDNTLRNTASTVDALKGSLLPLVQIFDTLNTVGGEYVIRLAEIISKQLESIGAYLQTAAGADKMRSIIDAGIGAIKQLWSLVAALGEALVIIFQISNESGGNLITTITKLVEQFNAFAKSAEGQKKLGDFFTVLNQVLEATLHIVGQVAGIIVTVVGAINSLPGPIQAVVVQFIAFGVVAAPIIAYLTRLAASFHLLGAALGFSGGHIATLGKHVVKILPVIGNAFATLGRVAVLAITSIGRAMLILLANPVFLAIGAAVLVIAGLAYLIISNWSSVSTFFVNLWNSVTAAFTAGVAAVSAWLARLWATVVTTWQGIHASITNALNTIKNTIVSVWQAIYGFLQPILNFILNLYIIVFGGILLAVITVVKAIYSTITSVFNTIAGFIGSILRTILGIYVSVWSAILNTVSTVLRAILGVITSVWNTVFAFVSGVLSRLAGIVSAIWNSIFATISSILRSIAATVSSIWNTIYAFIAGAVNRVLSIISSGFNAARNAAASAFNSMVSAISGAMNSALSVVGGVINRIRGLFAGAGGWLVGAGRSIIQGLINGIGNMAGAVAAKVQGIADGIKNRIKSALSIRSPSRVMEKYGMDTGQGLANGIGKMKSTVTDVAGTLANSLTGVFENMPNTATLTPATVGVSAPRLNSGSAAGQVTINLNGDQNFSNRADIDYFMTELGKRTALAKKGLV